MKLKYKEKLQPLFKNWQKIINVGNDLTATGTTSLEMLENIPSIDINQLSGTISLRGNENVRVLVNGKPSNVNTAQLLNKYLLTR